MDTITVTGIVLSAVPAGEADRRVVILTKEQGRISAFAQGACRPKSPLLAAARPFVMGEFELYPRRDTYSLKSASVKEYFDSLIQDYDKMAYGCYFLELAGYFSAEHTSDVDLLNLLYLTLRALERSVMEKKLIRLVFEYRIFVISGEYPQIFTCTRCKKPLIEGYFFMEERGACCTECSRRKSGMYLSKEAVYTLQYILTVPLQRLYRFKITDELFQVLWLLLKQWKKRYLSEREFKSLSLIAEKEEVT